MGCDIQEWCASWLGCGWHSWQGQLENFDGVHSENAIRSKFDVVCTKTLQSPTCESGYQQCCGSSSNSNARFPHDSRKKMS